MHLQGGISPPQLWQPRATRAHGPKVTLQGKPEGTYLVRDSTRFVCYMFMCLCVFACARVSASTPCTVACICVMVRKGWFSVGLRLLWVRLMFAFHCLLLHLWSMSQVSCLVMSGIVLVLSWYCPGIVLVSFF